VTVGRRRKQRSNTEGSREIEIGMATMALEQGERFPSIEELEGEEVR
jgi:hypothetical protein